MTKMRNYARETNSDCCYVPKRATIVFLTCLGMAISHAQRVNLAVTVVTILRHQEHHDVIIGHDVLSVDYNDVNSSKVVMSASEVVSQSNIPNVDWDARMIGFLHSVFYIGYSTTQIPGGYLATRFPPNRLFGACIAISCALNLLIPVCIAHIGFAATCTVRCLQGISEGLLFPGSYGIMRYWTMPEERGRMGALVLTGVYVGPVLGLPISGYLTDYFGWQYIYYFKGGMGLTWCLIWFYFSYERPATHPTISEDELKMIQERQGNSTTVLKDEKIPWGNILKSLPVNSLNVCNFARSFVFFLLLTNSPTYLATFGYTVAETGIYCAIPHIMMSVSAAISGPIADHLWTNPLLTTTDIRKLFTFLGFGIQSLCLFCLFFIYDGAQALLYLTLGIGISGLTVSGWHINHLDLAPRYASVMVGLTTASGTIAGIITPMIVGAMTVEQTIEDWQSVMLLTALILAAATVFYLAFGSAEKQPWAEPNVCPETKLLSDDDLKKKSYMGDDYDIQSFSDLLKKEGDIQHGLESGNPNSHIKYSDSDEELDNRYGSTLQYEDDKKSASNGRTISSTDKKAETPQKR